MEFKLCNQVISILIDLSSNYSYVSPNIVEKCHLAKEVHVEPWLVQLKTRTKRKKKLLGEIVCV